MWTHPLELALAARLEKETGGRLKWVRSTVTGERFAGRASAGTVSAASTEKRAGSISSMFSYTGQTG